MAAPLFRVTNANYRLQAGGLDQRKSKNYPCIVYGSTPELINPAVQSTQVANFASLSTSYSITLSGDQSDFDTIFDMWLTPQPNGAKSNYELEIVPQSEWNHPASALAYILNDSTLQNASVYVVPGFTDGIGNFWTNISILPSSNVLAGTISISDILKSLIWHGVITGQEYLSGIEFGPEPGAGSGSLLVKNLSYQWNGTPTVELTAGNDTFKIATPGGNDVVGNGGVDTVIYDGLYAQFQIKSSGSETLVTENNNISTLDYLEGVTYIEFSDGTYDTVTSTFTPGSQDTGPVETVSNLTATHGESFAASSLFSYSDPVGSAATEYDFWNTGGGDGYFALNGTALGANQDNIITAAQLSQLTYQSGSGTDTLWVRANDGTLWGAWSNAFTVTAPIDTGPVETVSNLTATHGESFAAASLFSYSDPVGSAATEYDFWDTGGGGGYFALNGTALGANQNNIITAAQLSQLTYQSGSGTDTLWVRANDGTLWGPWSNAFTVTAPIDSGPVETVSNLTATHGESFAAASLFSYSDPVGSAATEYDFWDTGGGGDYFALNGTALGANQNNIITAAQLSQLTYQSGSGTDTLWVRANDGTLWGPWSNAFTVTAPIDSGPVVTPVNSSISSIQGQSFAAASLFTYSDPFGSAATEYDFWDTGKGGGYFALNGTALGANQNNVITAAQLSQLTYQVGSGTDTLWVEANDGTVWGPWSNSFTISDPSTIGAGATLELASAFSGECDVCRLDRHAATR